MKLFFSVEREKKMETVCGMLYAVSHGATASMRRLVCAQNMQNIVYNIAIFSLIWQFVCSYLLYLYKFEMCIMVWITRSLENQFDSILQKGKVLVVYGARRAGKTSVIEKLLKNRKEKIFSGTGDDIDLRNLLSSENKNRITTSFRGYDIVFIDTAGRLQNKTNLMNELNKMN